MEDEREQTPKEKIIWGHRYTCDACDAEGEIHETVEAAQAEQDKHRDRKHGGLRPRAGDSIEKVELRREPIAESESSSGSGGGWILLLIIIVIAYAASK
ncbi:MULTISPECIES: hypothetical protein [Streptomyces]|uniref:hypothetical protein n=1 Tax=Streptomyces TaxID=1883 RepID=UPI0005B9DBFE|nr:MULTISPECIES: hypothetical protein [Streptomyces]MDP9953195.1 hypothetical protein [Streptomyces sp. DSM 41269]